jgi:hypothetical protein
VTDQQRHGVLLEAVLSGNYMALRDSYLPPGFIAIGGIDYPS